MKDINAWQFGIVTVAGYLGLGIFQFPRELISLGGAEAGWAFLLVSAFFLGLLWLFLKVAAVDAEHSLSFNLGRIMTPVLAWPIRGYRVGMHLLLAVVVVANFGEVMREFFLLGTPAWAIEVGLVATALYTAWFGTAVLARTLETIFLPTIIGSLLIGLLVLHHMQFVWALLPVLRFQPHSIVSAAYHSAYVFVGSEMVSQLYAHVRVDGRAMARRWAFWMFLFTVVFLAFGYLVVVGIEGPGLIAMAQWPPVSAMRLADIGGFFISKLGLLVVVLWGLFAMAFVAVRLWCLGHDLSENADRSVSTARYHLALTITGIAVVAGAQCFPNVVVLVHFIQVWVLPLVMIYLIGFPLIFLIAAYLHGRFVRVNDRRATS